MEARAQTCAACGDRIGVYEPLFWQRPDGIVISSSLLRMRDDPAFAPDAVLWHDTCPNPADVR
jgi:hypothetical protein